MWNDPYGFSWGPGERFPRLPALPQAAWFFAASPRCYLSFRDDLPAQGFFAQVFSNEGFRPQLIKAALALPFAPRASRRMLRTVILEDASQVECDPREWHSYRIQWGAAGCTFTVDKKKILETQLSPRAPLGLVLWIDNQYAAFDPQGRIRWGVEADTSVQWLEVEDLTLSEAGSSPIQDRRGASTRAIDS